jgi:hypothetical protein
MYTLQGKSDQHTTRIPHSVYIWSQTICISRGQCKATFHVVINGVEQGHYSWEKGLSTQSIARRLIDPRVHTQFLFQDSHWNSGAKSAIYWWPATRLTGLISPACDWYIQYLLRRANPLELNWHRQGLQPPKGPARSQVIQSQHKPREKCDTKHLSPTRILLTTQRLPKSIATPNNG